eukprot:CAMPEP_0177794978 /NCGR_PEP_ID=MMETSP0491_2-20121128/25956_1 /TAXON_ID=63592 /ORGANISM="Tetraselmis chuii, Strain PLY429" /LENGTH=92 /DNA_ID=CAMNT_0019317715 /DNA_START=1517 /DNA_END=1792 /DNA_ORIENTATION=+
MAGVYPNCSTNTGTARTGTVARVTEQLAIPTASMPTTAAADCSPSLFTSLDPTLVADSAEAWTLCGQPVSRCLRRRIIRQLRHDETRTRGVG